MAVMVEFCVNLGNDTCVGEDRINADLGHYYLELAAVEERDGAIDGAVLIRVPGEPEVKVEDEFEAIVENLCSRAIPDLVAGRRVVVRYFQYCGYLRLDPEDQNMLISGDFVPKVRTNLRETALGFYECGQRFLEFWLRYKENDPAYVASVQDMMGEADKSRKAIDTAEIAGWGGRRRPNEWRRDGAARRSNSRGGPSSWPPSGRSSNAWRPRRSPSK